MAAYICDVPTAVESCSWLQVNYGQTSAGKSRQLRDDTTATVGDSLTLPTDRVKQRYSRRLDAQKTAYTTRQNAPASPARTRRPVRID